MDPTATFRLLAEAVEAEDWPSAEEHASNLHEWMKRGGFAPEITGNAKIDRVVAENTCQAILLWEVA